MDHEKQVKAFARVYNGVTEIAETRQSQAGAGLDWSARTVIQLYSLELTLPGICLTEETNIRWVGLGCPDPGQCAF